MLKREKLLTGTLAGVTVLGAGLSIGMSFVNEVSENIINIPLSIVSLFNGVQEIYNEDQRIFTKHNLEERKKIKSGEIAFDTSLEEGWAIGRNLLKKNGMKQNQQNFEITQVENIYKAKSIDQGTMTLSLNIKESDMGQPSGTIFNMSDVDKNNSLWYSQGFVNEKHFEDFSIVKTYFIDEIEYEIDTYFAKTETETKDIMYAKFSLMIDGERTFDSIDLNENEWDVISNSFNSFVEAEEDSILKKINFIVNETKYDYTNQK